MDELSRRYKRMAREIARSLGMWFTLEEALAMERYSGEAECQVCGLKYYDHPELIDGPANGLHVTCRGKLVKL